MLLVITERGRLAKAIRKQAKRLGWDVSFARPDADDLFMKALHRRALVYLAAPNMLEGVLGPRPDVERVQRVLSASNAPGVEVIVAVFPAGGAFAEEMTAIRRYGKAYVMLELPALLEEIGDAIGQDDASRLWLPKGGGARVARARQAARAVIAGVLTEAQGRTERVEGRELDPPALFLEAAHSVGKQVAVHGVWPVLHRAVRPVARWLGGGEPKALALTDRLCVQQSAA